MRSYWALLAVCTAQLCNAQVDVDTPVQLVGTEPQRTIEGLASPVQSDAMITVEGAVRAEWTWATANLQADTLMLAVPLAPATFRDGLLLRFLAPTALHGALWLRLPGHTPMELVRTDGLPVAEGQIAAGQVCEVMRANARFYLLNAPDTGCPSGYLQVNDGYCIESLSSAPVEFYDAVDQCAAKGGKLCTWNEYVAACTLLAGQFGNMHTDWDWIDDTANHLHTMNQAGRTTCASNRSIVVNVVARVRCCHHLR